MKCQRFGVYNISNMSIVAKPGQKIFVFLGDCLKIMGAVLKVSSKSNPNLVAGALAGTVREDGRAELHAIGAGATNQAVKAVAIARGLLAEAELVCIPSFYDLLIDDQIRTSIKLIVEPRQPR